MKVVILKNYEACAAYTAAYIEKKIFEALPTQDAPFVLGLPTGSTPVGVYKLLAQRFKAGFLSFEHVVTFNMDEYVGLPAVHPESYHHFMMQNLFDHVNIQKQNINILDGMASDLQSECDLYEEKIKKYGKIDLFFGGVGNDGHIAFNEPGTSLASRTHVQSLALDTIRVNSRFFAGDETKVPTKALTVGIGTIMDAKEVLIMACGEAKAKAVAAAIEGAISHMWTISALQMHPNALIVCDEDAMEEVKVKTYRYFKHTQQL